MASEGAHRIRKDFKFEIFLKRSLDPDEFERVRFYDFSVVTSRKEDRAYKYVVLTDEWIYLTENPPKTVTREVNLRDVIAIEWMRDFPNFLDGDLKKIAQHICVKFTYKSSGRRSRRDRLSSINAGDGPYTTRSHRSDLTSTESTVGLVTSRSIGRNHAIVPPLQLEGEPMERYEGAEDPLKAENERIPDATPSLEGKNSLCNCLSCCRAIEPTPVLNDAAPEENGSPEEIPEAYEENGVLGMYTRRSLRLSLDDLRPSPRVSFRDTTYRGSMRSQHPYHSEHDEKKVGELHLYILNGETPVLLLFRSAWNTCMLRGTRMLDEQYENRCTPRGKILQDEAVSFLYTRLKGELFEAIDCLDTSFELTNELMNATERNFAIKKLFWRNPDLFSFLVCRLRHYLPNSKAKLYEPEGRIHRADELDYCILVMDTLKLMLQETETLASRNNCLRYRGGKECMDLVDLLSGKIALPEEYQPLSEAAAKLLNQTDTESELRQVNRELQELREQFTSSGAGILYELLVTGRNVSEGPNDALPTENKLVRQIESSSDVKEFLRRLVENTLQLIAPSPQNSKLRPMKAVNVFQQFSVLRSLVLYSRQMKSMLQENYMEEFRYFVQPPVVMEKLSRKYLITWPTLSVIEEVTGVITGKKNLFDEEECLVMD